MKRKPIEFSRLGASGLFQDYLNHSPDLSAFYSYPDFASDEVYRELIKSRKIFADRTDVVDVLLEFNRDCGAGQETLDSIKALRNPDTFTVVTGQQLVLFGGPLFTLFKVMTTIALSRFITKKTGKKVIPVFWLADEDHDYEEIASVFVPQGDSTRKLTAGPHEKAGFAAGELSAGIARDQIDAFLNLLPETDFTGDVRELLNQSWGEKGNWKDAFGNLMLRVFGKYGLVLCGSHHPAIKKITAPVLETAVKKAEPIHRALETPSAALEDSYHAQAYVSSSQLFLHDEQRGRLKLDFESKSNRWRCEDQRFDGDQLLKMVAESPERFSPNVFLRPVLQEFLLPNLAYVGGPAETAYFAQTKEMFAVFGMDMPVIVPRLSATFVEPAISRILPDLPFEFGDYLERIEQLEKTYVAKTGDENPEPFFHEWKRQMRELTDEKAEFMKAADPSLTGAVNSFSSRTEKEIDKLEQKYNRALKNREKVQLSRIGRVKEALFPMSGLQERTVSWLYFMNKYGTGLTDELLKIFDEQELEYLKQHQIIEL